jgi:hypothetical protein
VEDREEGIRERGGQRREVQDLRWVWEMSEVVEELEGNRVGVTLSSCQSAFQGQEESAMCCRTTPPPHGLLTTTKIILPAQSLSQVFFLPAAHRLTANNPATPTTTDTTVDTSTASERYDASEWIGMVGWLR